MQPLNHPKESVMNSENSSSASTVLLALLGGTILGAGIALLYAPQSGRRTRQKLKDLGEDAEDYARGILERAAEEVDKAGRSGEEWVEKGREFVEEKKREMLGTSHDGSKKA
jgi:gas vesicle protein